MRRLAIALAFALSAHAASATVVTYTYQGTVTSATGIFAGQGTSVTGTFSFDTGLTDSEPATTHDAFDNNSPVGNQALTSTYSATVHLGAVSLSATASPHPTLAVGRLDLFNNFPASTNLADEVFYELGNPFTTDPLFELDAQQLTPSPTIPNAVPNGVLNGTTSGAISLLDTLDLTKFSVTSGLWLQKDSNGQTIGSLGFTWTSVAPVPLPAALPLLISGLLGFVGVGARARRKHA